MSGNGHKRPLRLLHVDPEQNWGGGEAQVFGLLSYLAEQGHENLLLAHPEGQLAQRARLLNVECRAFPVRNELDMAAVFRFRQMTAREPFDIVHFHTKRAHALAFWARRDSIRPRYMVTRRMDYPLKKNWYTHALYNNRVDMVIAISNFIARVLMAGGVEPRKVRVVPSGIDVARFENPVHGRDNDPRPTIGSLAVMEERKGQRDLLEAARLLKNRGRSFRYILGGDGPLRNQLQEKAGELGLNDEIHFPGWIGDVPRFFSSIDFFVMPSRFEGLGVAALEAMAARRAVVATNVGGLPESVVDRETGFLVPPRDPPALAAAIEKLAADASLAQTMGKRGAERVREHFSLARMAAANESCYYSALGESTEPREGIDATSRSGGNS